MIIFNRDHLHTRYKIQLIVRLLRCENTLLYLTSTEEGFYFIGNKQFMAKVPVLQGLCNFLSTFEHYISDIPDCHTIRSVATFFLPFVALL